jgi:cobalt-zinc-cadmium efflux system membrane fusion protein
MKYPLLLIVLAGCASSTPESTATPASETPSLFVVPPEQRARLALVKVARTSVTRTVSVPARIAFDDLKTSEVTPLVSGKVTKVLVHEGDHVKIGEALLTIASPDSSDNAANLARDRAELRSKQTILARDQDLYAHKAIALEELQQATLDVESAQTTVRADEERMAITGSKSGDAVLPSPIDGVVVTRRVAVGDAISAGATPCFTITDPTAVWAVSQLYQEDLRRVAVGDVARVRSPVLDAPIDGKVLHIGAALDPDTLTIPVRVAAQNPTGVLKSGMYVDVEIVPATREQALLLPAAAILRDADNLPFVYVQRQPGEFARRLIGLGDQVGDRFVITKGLDDGEQVLTDGALFVQFADALEK